MPVTALAGLVLFPGETLMGISYVVGGISVIMGVARTVRYFQQGHGDPFLFGIVLIGWSVGNILRVIEAKAARCGKAGSRRCRWCGGFPGGNSGKPAPRPPWGRRKRNSLYRAGGNNPAAAK